jgi:predicted aminopeptidase
MPEGIGRTEFTSFCERIHRTLEEGFRQVNQRLDTTNGRIYKGEQDRAAILERVAALEAVYTQISKESDEERAERRATLGRRVEDRAGAGEKWAGSLTKREQLFIAGGLTAITVLVEVIKFMAKEGWQLLEAAGRHV